VVVVIIIIGLFLVFLSWSIPVGVFAFWADFGYLVDVVGFPFVSASVAFVTFYEDVGSGLLFHFKWFKRNLLIWFVV